MERRFWQYATARAPQGKDFMEAKTLTELGLSGWEAYAAHPDPSAGDWIIFLKREMDEATANQVRIPR